MTDTTDTTPAAGGNSRQADVAPDVLAAALARVRMRGEVPA